MSVDKVFVFNFKIMSICSKIRFYYDDMLKVLRLFHEDPMQEFHEREVVRSIDRYRPVFGPHACSIDRGPINC